MKKLFILSVAILISFGVFAQVPQKMSYQCVVRNASGELITNQGVGIKISILQGTSSWTVIYSEIYSPNPLTNANGLVTIEIGEGTPITGTFSAIDWAKGPYFLKTETDPAGGTSYTISGTSQLLSVPYALHANTVQKGDNWGTDIVQTDATLSGNGTSVTPLQIAPNGVTSAKIQDGSIEAADLTNSAVITAKIGNLAVSAEKIQNGAVTTDKLANNSVIADKINAGAVTGAKIAQAGATNGQALKWAGTTWAPADDALGGLTLPYNGTGTSGSPLFNIVNLGTSGGISTLSNGTYGILGESASSSGMGVYGVNKTSTGTTYGVFGDVYSATGYSGYFQGGRFYVQGNTGIGTQNPGAKLEVAGQVKITGGSPGTGKVLTSDASGLASWVSPTITWLKNDNNVYYNSGNVGIGLNNPTGMMEIYGNSVDLNPTLLLSEVDGYSRVSFRTMSASTKHWVLAGHTNLTDANSQWHLNYFNGSDGKNIFSVYGNSDIAFDGNVGIGTQSPGAKLDVAGQVKITGGTPGAGKVLTSNAAGLASWQAPELSPWLKNGSNLYYNSGNVAIGMTFPRYDLTIYNDNNPQIGFYNSTSGTSGTDGFTIGTNSSGSPVWIWNWENSNMHFGTNNANRMVINANGQVDIINLLNINCDVSSGTALKVNGKQALWWDGTYFSWGYDGTYNYFADAVTIKSAGVPGYDLVVNGTAAKTGGGSWSNLSDARMKNINGNYKKGLNEIIALQPVMFTYKEGNPRQLSSFEEQVGFIAQDVQKVFPEAVNLCKDGYFDFNMHSVNVALVNAVKELKTENDQLKARISSLESRFEEIEALMNMKAEKKH